MKFCVRFSSAPFKKFLNARGPLRPPSSVLTDFADRLLTDFAEPVLTDFAEPVLTEPVLTEPVLADFADLFSEKH